MTRCSAKSKAAPRKSGGGGFGAPKSGQEGGLSDRAKRLLKKHKNNLDAATADYFQTRLQKLAPPPAAASAVQKQPTSPMDDDWEVNQSQRQKEERTILQQQTSGEDVQDLWRQARLAATWDAIALFLPPQKVVDASLREKLETIVQQAAGGAGPLLDVGCGDGNLVPFWKEYSSNEDYWGMDVSEEMISLAQRQYGALSGVDFQLGSFPSDVSPNVKFGCILWNASWQFFPNNPLPEAVALLKDGGRFVVCHTQGAKFVREECRKNPSIAVQQLPTLEEWKQYASELGMEFVSSSDDLEFFHLLVMEKK